MVQIKCTYSLWLFQQDIFKEKMYCLKNQVKLPAQQLQNLDSTTLSQHEVKN